MLLDGLLRGIHNKKQKGYCMSQMRSLRWNIEDMDWYGKCIENVWTCLDHSICSLRQHNFHPCLHMCVQNTFGWTFAWLFLSPSSNPWSVTTQRFRVNPWDSVVMSQSISHFSGYTPLSKPFKTQQSLWVSSICKSSMIQNLRISLHISIYVIKPSWNIQYICDACIYIYIYTMYNTSNVHYMIIYICMYVCNVM